MTGPLGNRLLLIDSLRALALFGVIVMNIGAMAMRFVGRDVMASAGPPDFVLMGLDLAFVQGKARACFAFLFGLGFAILLQRAERAGGDFRGFYARRMAVLLGFGLINQAFLFWGDILCLYALLGFVLLPLRSCTNRTLLRLGLALVALPPLAVGGFEAASGRPFPNLIDAAPAADTARALAALTGGDYRDAILFNLPQTAMRYATDSGHMLVYALGVLGLFLLGAWTGRRGLAFDVAGHAKLLRRIAWTCLPAGLLLSLVHASRLVGIEAEGWRHGLVTAAYLGLPVMAFGYLAALILIFARRMARAQALLAPAGRMALTNYLLSGAIGGWVMYGYGLGALRAFSFAGLNLLAAAIFAALAVFSHFWLKRFSLGPAEWLWRSLSYGAWQPMRRGSERPALA
ncbi:MAG: DUF418 domain-containing protein [Allosphingosinicella sp.]